MVASDVWVELLKNEVFVTKNVSPNLHSRDESMMPENTSVGEDVVETLTLTLTLARCRNVQLDEAANNAPGEATAR